MKDRFDTDYQIGQDNVKKWGIDVHPAFFCRGFPGCHFYYSNLVESGRSQKGV
jgi:surfactin synthase thioesterase subunit